MVDPPDDRPTSPGGVTDGGPPVGRVRGGEAVRLHLALVFALTLCTAAFLFEVHRALAGNDLSWAYVFEWPLFAVYALYMWWKLLHPGPRQGRAARDRRPQVAPEHLSMLLAWEEHRRQVAGNDGSPGTEGTPTASGSPVAGSPVTDGPGTDGPGTDRPGTDRAPG